MAINVGRSPNDRSLINGLASTIQSVFPSVYVIDVPDSFNSMIYATLQPTGIMDLYDNVNQLIKTGGVHPLLLEALATTVVNLKPTPPMSVVYTDDWAPIELITNNMVLNFIFFGDMSQIEK
jgi:hypothetical protein